MLDVQMLGDELVAIVREHVGRAVAQLREEHMAARLEVAELRGMVKALQVPQAAVVDKALPDIDGLLSPMRAEAANLAQELSGAKRLWEATWEEVEALKSAPKPEPAAPIDPAPLVAEAITPLSEQIHALHEQLVEAERTLSLLGVDLETLKSLPAPKVPTDAIRSAVAEAIAAIPLPKDGNDGKSLTIDDVAPIAEGYWAKWALEFERRGMDMLTRTVEQIPLPKDGKDGLSLEDFHAELKEDGRTIVFSVTHGDFVKSVEIRIPVLIDAGQFVEGKSYAHGDAVTYGGSLWAAQVDAPNGLPGQSKDWRLAVKKGRDGKDGDKGEQGKKGADGRDLRPWPYVPAEGGAA